MNASRKHGTLIRIAVIFSIPGAIGQTKLGDRSFHAGAIASGEPQA